MGDSGPVRSVQIQMPLPNAQFVPGGGAEAPVSPTAVSSAVRPLDYGRGSQPGRLRRRHLVIGSLLVACIAGSWTNGRSARQQTQDLLYIRQASRHVEPANTIVFESDTDRAADLIEAGTHVSLSREESGPAVLREPDAMKVLRSAAGGRAIETVGALVFLHELVTPSGARRIVAVQFLPHYLDGRTLPGAGLVAHIFEPGGFISEPRRLGQSHAQLLLPVVEETPLLPADHPPVDPLLLANAAAACLGPTSPVLQEAVDPWGSQALRWYAGQPDELDSTHFTIDYEVAGHRGTIDGYLSDDGSHVRMQPRNASAVPPGSAFMRISAPAGIIR